MSAIDKHYLNGIDVFKAYGLIVASGSAGFLTGHKRKDSVINNWREENGVDIDLSLPRFENNSIALNCFMAFQDEADYATKKNNLMSVFSSGGWKDWRVVDHEKTYKVYYTSETNTQKVTGTLEGFDGYSAVSFTLNLIKAVEDSSLTETVSSNPVFIYNSDSTLYKIAPEGSQVTLEPFGDTIEEYEFNGSNITNKVLIIPKYSKTSEYDVVVFGYEQPKDSYSVNNNTKQVIFTENIPSNAFLIVRIYNAVV